MKPEVKGQMPSQTKGRCCFKDTGELPGPAKHAALSAGQLTHTRDALEWEREVLSGRTAKDERRVSS